MSHHVSSCLDDSYSVVHKLPFPSQEHLELLKDKRHQLPCTSQQDNDNTNEHKSLGKRMEYVKSPEEKETAQNPYLNSFMLIREKRRSKSNDSGL